MPPSGRKPGRTFAIVAVCVRAELRVEVRGGVEQPIGDPPGQRLIRIEMTSQVPVSHRMRTCRKRLFRDRDELE